MYLLFSGEGPSDLGKVRVPGTLGEGENFLPGPMAIIADQIVEERFHYSSLDTGACGFIAEPELTARASELKAAGKSLRLPGAKRAKETRYFFNNARALARIAQELQALLRTDVVAVLFRDSDGTASAGRGLWDEKWTSMLHGFEEEGFTRGVPMLPRPKSEAWILCAVKRRYQDCWVLEARSGNDHSPNSLKSELADAIGGAPTRELLCEMVRDARIDFRRIEMPSFVSFRGRLQEAIEDLRT